MKLMFKITTILFLTTLSIYAAKPGSINGTWCVSDDGFILAFSGKDSIHVSSSSDESIKAAGVYQKSDSILTATVVNGDVTMKMKYRYHWAGADSIKALTEQFTINDEPVTTPAEWMYMVRCNTGEATGSNDQKQSTSTSKKK